MSHSRSRRAPIGVAVRSSTQSSEPRRSPPSVCSSSRFRRVAASSWRKPAGAYVSGGRRWAGRRREEASTYASAPPAARAARHGSSPSTGAGSGSRAVAQGRPSRHAASTAGGRSGARSSSRGARRSSSSRTSSQPRTSLARKAPVAKSMAAMPKRSPSAASAASRLGAPGSRLSSSRIVPGVMTRAPWRPPDRRSPTASAMGDAYPNSGPLCQWSGRTRLRRRALPDGGAPYLQTFLQPFLRQLCEQQSASAVQVAPDGKHAGSVVVVLLVDAVVVVVAATVVVVGAAVVVVVVVDTLVVVVVVGAVAVVVVPATGGVVVVLGRVVVVVVLGRVVVVLVGPAAASRFRAWKLPSPVTRS